MKQSKISSNRVEYILPNSACDQIEEVAEELAVSFHQKRGGLQVYQEIAREIDEINITDRISPEKFQEKYAA